MVKLLVSALFVVTVVSFKRYALAQLVPYIFYPMLLTALCETPYAMLVKRFFIALPFCLFAGISNVLFYTTAAFTINGITVSYGFISLFTILFKTYLCVMSVLILVSVTPFYELTGTLRRLRTPGIFITMFEMTYRYIGVLLYEAYSMNIAYSLRAYSPRAHSPRSRNRKSIEMKDMGSFAGFLLIRSFDRADRVYNAMKCRGYALQSIPQNSKRLKLKDITFLCIVFCYV
jgi:cobalt/nickel transport system permease protein